MKTDSFFKIGSSHRICQDYCYHKDDMVSLSDGCSTAPCSCIGARLLVHSATLSPQIIKLMDLPEESLCATLLTLKYGDETNSITGTMFGDGLMLAGKHNGEIEEFNLEFSSGAPYYPKYEMLNERQEYINQMGQTYSINGVVQQNGFFEDYPDGMVVKEFAHEVYDFVAIFSDGINSFYKKIKEETSIRTAPIHRSEILKELLSIKGFNGSFVQRRCQKAFAKFAAEGVEHFDDFSMGIMKL